jgi:hypothetical protein
MPAQYDDVLTIFHQCLYQQCAYKAAGACYQHIFLYVAKVDAGCHLGFRLCLIIGVIVDETA